MVPRQWTFAPVRPAPDRLPRRVDVAVRCAPLVERLAERQVGGEGQVAEASIPLLAQPLDGRTLFGAPLQHAPDLLVFLAGRLRRELECRQRREGGPQHERAECVGAFAVSDRDALPERGEVVQVVILDGVDRSHRGDLPVFAG